MGSTQFGNFHVRCSALSLHGHVSMRMQWGRHLDMTCVLTLCAELLPRLDAPGLQCTAPRDSIDLNLENHC
jgi:hypothetical protein